MTFTYKYTTKYTIFSWFRGIISGMKTIKTVCLPLAIAILAFAFSGCSMGNEMSLGTVTFSFDRAGRAALYDPATISKLSLTVKVAGGSFHEKTDIREGDTVTFQVATGDCEVMAYAHLNGNLMAVGFEKIKVKPGPNGTFYIHMREPDEFSDGTAARPFFVYNETTLRRVGTETVGWSLGAHYRQIDNITLNPENHWTPIGLETIPFTGVYDGGEYAISRLSVGGGRYQGLFGGMRGGAIKNVRLVDVGINGDSFVGGVVGYNLNGKVENCQVKGDIYGSGNYVGGVVGYNLNGTVENCHITGAVFGEDHVGGVVGISSGSNGKVIACGFSMDVMSEVGVRGNNENTGGVVGNNSGGIVQRCYSNGNVDGKEAVGGIAGVNSGGAKVQNCYAAGDVCGSASGVGGVVGSNKDAGSAVEYCYATGDIEGYDRVGGVVGYNDDDATVKNCVALSLNITINVSGATFYIARITENSSASLSNNYGRLDAQLYRDATIPVIMYGTDVTGIDGGNITSSQYYGGESWWKDSSGVWSDPWSVYNWLLKEGQLPALQNLPGQSTVYVRD